MQLRRLSSPPPQSPFAPSWDIPLGLDSFSDRAALTRIREIVLARESSLKARIAPRPIAGIADGLTSRWYAFNIFAWPEPEMAAFRRFVKEAYLGYLEAMGVARRRCYVQGWANVVRRKERFAPHSHDQSPLAYLSGNFVVASGSTHTLYFPPYLYNGAPSERAQVPIANRPGLLTLFPSAIQHATTHHDGPEERITLAFDIFLQDYDLDGRSGAKGRHLLFDDPETSPG